MTSLPAEITAVIAPPSTSRLHPFDVALIVGYLLGITLFGLRFRKSRATGLNGKPDKSLKNYFLANNTVDRERMFISRASTVWWAIVLFTIAVYSVHTGGKGHVVETGLSIASGCLLGVFLLGTLTRFVTQTGAILGMICGFALNLALWLQPEAIVFRSGFTIPKVAFTWYVLIGALATFAIGSLTRVVFRGQSTSHH